MSTWNFDPKLGPIYIQLGERVIEQVLGKQVQLGDKLPSAREFAEQVGLNPNTVRQTFQELERLQITESKRGLGTYIRQDLNLDQLRKDRLKTMIDDLINKSKALGIDQQSIESIVLERLKNYDG